jgi:hypothetical protein
MLMLVSLMDLGCGHNDVPVHLSACDQHVVHAPSVCVCVYVVC